MDGQVLPWMLCVSLCGVCGGSCNRLAAAAVPSGAASWAGACGPANQQKGCARRGQERRAAGCSARAQVGAEERGRIAVTGVLCSVAVLVVVVLCPRLIAGGASALQMAVSATRAACQRVVGAYGPVRAVAARDV